MSDTDSQGGRRWSSRLIFVIAAIGFAVGLGNLWRFPYLAGQNGGGAFILLYVGAVFVIGLPLVIAELAIGRKGGADPARAWRQVATAEGRSPWWGAIGYFGVTASFLVVSFYCVIGGWTLAFAWTGVNTLAGIGGTLDFVQGLWRLLKMRPRNGRLGRAEVRHQSLREHDYRNEAMAGQDRAVWRKEPGERGEALCIKVSLDH